MPVHAIDHLVITAPTLEIGTQWVYEQLGVMPQIGGEHERMGTHNRLLKLGETIYLEVIAINPNIQTQRPRWFDLDQPHTNKPTLKTWVVNTTDIHTSAIKMGESIGAIEPMSRGNLNWLITIPSDGSLPLQGIAPTLIQWLTAPHPATRLENQGCALTQLDLYHPESQRLNTLLSYLSLNNSVNIKVISSTNSFIKTHIQTPTGIKII